MDEYVIILTTSGDVLYRKLTSDDNRILDEIAAEDWIVNTLGIGDMFSFVFVTQKPRLREL